MKKQVGWIMYYRMQELKQLGLNKSQVAHYLGVARNTLYKYWDMTPLEYEKILKEAYTRESKLDPYETVILEWLTLYPDLSAAQIKDWLEEKLSFREVGESTVRRYVSVLRKEYNIPKLREKRAYEAVPDPPMGHQAQVDFGVVKMLDYRGIEHKLWFITFVLSHSRYKYVEWLNRPFTTADVIQAHEHAFTFYGGIPHEIVYDQDHLLLVSENHGDLIHTKEFAVYLAKKKFAIFMCRKADPESKGRVENVVKFIKMNFVPHRMYKGLDRLNEECLAWLERTGNGKKHNTTKKIPAEVFLLEKGHLKPDTERLQMNISKNSISRQVRKDNTVWYESNRYSVPLGTYKGPETEVSLEVTDGHELIICLKQTNEEIARHEICYKKGELIQKTNHRRDRSKGIAEFMDHVALLFPQSDKARVFLEKIYQCRSRYIRDQLQLIKQSIDRVDSAQDLLEQALDYCLENELYSATNFRDALDYFKDQQEKLEPLKDGSQEEQNIKLIHDSATYEKVKIKPQIREIEAYIKAIGGV